MISFNALIKSKNINLSNAVPTLQSAVEKFGHSFCIVKRSSIISVIYASATCKLACYVESQFKKRGFFQEDNFINKIIRFSAKYIVASTLVEGGFMVASSIFKTPKPSIPEAVLLTFCAICLEKTYKIGKSEFLKLYGSSNKNKTISGTSSYLKSILPKSKVSKLKLTTDILNESEKNLNEGINISEDTKVELIKLIPQILNIKRDEEIEGVRLFNSQQTHRVFSLTSLPGIIFKMNTNNWIPYEDQTIKKRYNSMIEANAICRHLQKDSEEDILILPKGKLFTVTVGKTNHHIIAEEELYFSHYNSTQEKLFEENSDKLAKALEIYAKFICEFDASDVEFRNNPVLNDQEDSEGNYKIGLPDIEERQGAKWGLFGNGGKPRGLIGHAVTEEQFKMIYDIAVSYSVDASMYEGACQRRRKELENNKSLKKFYEKNNIHEDELIDLDLIDTKLKGFSDDEKVEKKCIALAKGLINEINERIRSSFPEETIKGQRSIFIETNKQENLTFYQADYTLVCKPENWTRQGRFNATLLGIVTNKLKELGVIHMITDMGSFYYVQA